MLLRNDGVLPLARTGAHRGDRARTPTTRYAHARLLLVPVARRRAAPGRRRSASACRPCSTRCAPSSRTPRSRFARGHRRRRRRDRRASRTAAALAASADVVVARPRRPRRPVRPRHERRGLRRAPSLELPGAQQAAAWTRVLATGTPDRARAARRPAVRARTRRDGVAPAIVQAFFPGEEGAHGDRRRAQRPGEPQRAAARERSGDRRGRSRRRYLAAPLARAQRRVNIDPTAAFPFGHGLGYTRFDVVESFDGEDAEIARRRRDHRARSTCATRGTAAGAEVVQLYLHDPVASVVRPVQRLIGFARVELEPGQGAEVASPCPPTWRRSPAASGDAIVEPGELVLGVGPLERRRAVQRTRCGSPARRASSTTPAGCTPWSRSRSSPRHPGPSSQPTDGPCTTTSPSGRLPYPAGGGAVLSRTTRLVARSMRGVVATAPRRARRIASRAASSPMRRNGWCTVVSRGLIQRASGMSS